MKPRVVHVYIAPFVTMTFLLILWEADIRPWYYSRERDGYKLWLG